MPLHKNLRHLRKRNHWSQEELAAKLGVGRSTVTQWESGANSPRYGMIKRIARLFGIQVSELMGDSLPGVDVKTLPADADEARLLAFYRSLDEIGRAKLLAYAEGLQAGGEAREPGEGLAVQIA